MDEIDKLLNDVPIETRIRNGPHYERFYKFLKWYLSRLESTQYHKPHKLRISHIEEYLLIVVTHLVFQSV